MQGLKNADILMPQTFDNGIWSSYVSDLYGFGGSDKVWRAKLPEILQKCPGSILHNCFGSEQKKREPKISLIFVDWLFGAGGTIC